jgi:hypothetical protein
MTPTAKLSCAVQPGTHFWMAVRFATSASATTPQADG